MQLFRAESYIYPTEIDNFAVSVDMLWVSIPTRIPGSGGFFNH